MTSLYTEVIDVRKGDENDASDGFNLESPKFVHTYIHTDILISHTGSNVNDYFQVAVIEVKKTVKNAASYGFAPVYLENHLR